MDQPTQQVKKKAKRITLGLLAALIFFLLTVFLFWRLTDEIVLEKETGFDFKVFEILSRYTTPFTTKVMLLFTFFGSTTFLLPAYILLSAFFLFYKRNKLQSISVAAVGLSSIVLLYILKNIFHRHRPLTPLTPDVMGYSYPSGHSFSSFTFFGLFSYIIWKSNLPKFWKWILSVIFILLAVCIAGSRVYLHVHFASDVIAGFCLSIIWLSISLWVVQRIQRAQKPGVL
ncbi:MAG: phosphatase family protein [Chitinophagaceae bacterium]|nr:phosphatase family protein [Chitinophagaceae bacterium]